MKTQLAACARKVPYPSAAEAERASRGELSPYLCPVCARYHLTSAKKPRLAKSPARSEKPDFDDSLLLKARLKKPKAVPASVETTGVCTGRTGPDGRVRVNVNGQEKIVGPVQPATIRPQIKSGVKIRIKVQKDQAQFLGLA